MFVPNQKISIMKNFTLITIIILSGIIASCGKIDKKEDPNAVAADTVAAAYWAFDDGDTLLTYNSTINGTQIESDCNFNNKMWIVLGAVPTSNGTMKIVNYSKGTLASDELKIDIARMGDDYLSAGSDNAKARIIVQDGRISINFDTVVFARFGTNGPEGDSLRISGYLDQK